MDFLKFSIIISVVFAYTLFVLGCDEPKSTQVEKLVEGEPTPEQRQWLLECIKNGNPMSDEEGEDLVKQCEKTANTLFKLPLEKICWDSKLGEVSCEDWTTEINR